MSDAGTPRRAAPAARRPTTTRPAFPQRLRGAIEGSGLSLDALRRELVARRTPVGRSTLSVWQNGLRTPSGPASLRAVRTLEVVLTLPAGTLTDLLAEQEAPVDEGEVDTLLERIGCTGVIGRFDTRVSLTSVWMSRTGSVDRVESHVVEAVRASSDRFAVVFGGEDGGDASLLQPVVHSGGRLGRVARDAASNAVAAEILLDRSVAPGELVTLRYGVTDGNDLPATHFQKVNQQGATFSGLEVTFDPGRMPVALTEYERADFDAPDRLARPLSIGPSRRVSVVRERAPRGVVGVRWDYP